MQVGDKIGMNILLEKRGQGFHKDAIWKCQCDCGKITYVSSNNLTTKYNKTLSCGCYNRENKTKHNCCYTRLYKKWLSMKQRCYNPNNPYYKNYGGRGITICDEWLNNFLNFKEWAYNNGYDDNLGSFDCTIDRINNNGNYEPSNCRWVNMKVQMNNTRRNIKRD